MINVAKKETCFVRFDVKSEKKVNNTSFSNEIEYNETTKVKNQNKSWEQNRMAHHTYFFNYNLSLFVLLFNFGQTPIRLYLRSVPIIFVFRFAALFFPN